jgi:hypothetical protein
MSSNARLCCTLVLVGSIGAGCAVGSSGTSDTRRREVSARDARGEAPLDASVDLVSAADRAVDRRVDVVVDHPVQDLPRDQKTTPEADVGCGCGAGMICSGGTCVCDPKTCAGCCTSDGKSCKTGKDNAACGTSGVACTTCSTSDTCKTASCATGACVLTAKAGAPYPCPGAFGTMCGGGTGVVCYSGLVCVTFTSGAKGFCSKTCSSSGSTCSGSPSGMTAECNLLAGTQMYCGFPCSPGLCPTGLTCDYSEYLCKP